MPRRSGWAAPLKWEDKVRCAGSRVTPTDAKPCPIALARGSQACPANPADPGQGRTASSAELQQRSVRRRGQWPSEQGVRHDRSLPREPAQLMPARPLAWAREQQIGTWILVPQPPSTRTRTSYTQVLEHIGSASTPPAQQVGNRLDAGSLLRCAATSASWRTSRCPHRCPSAPVPLRPCFCAPSAAFFLGDPQRRPASSSVGEATGQQRRHCACAANCPSWLSFV